MEEYKKKKIIKIRTWNVRAMLEVGKMLEADEELRRDDSCSAGGEMAWIEWNKKEIIYSIILRGG